MGEMAVAEWQPWGPCQFSHEQGDGFLGTDYSNSVDHRYPLYVTLGPALNSVSLAAAGGTPANVSGSALSGSMNATLFLYLIRGTKWAKVQVSNMTLISDGTETALAEAATGILYTKNAAGTQEISVFMAGTAYRVISAVGAGATDTHAANSAALVFRLAGYGTPANVIALLGKQNTSIENVIAQNILTGTTTMATSSSVVTKATVSGNTFTFTGFALDGPFWLVGTSQGPLYQDARFDDEFRHLADALAKTTDTANCAQMTTWFAPIGTIIPLARGTRNSVSLGGQSIGPEVRLESQSLFQGRVTAIAGSEKWLYGCMHNTFSGDRFLFAARPAMLGDHHPGPVSYYCLGKFSSACEHAVYLGNAGGRTQPTWVFGNGSNMVYVHDGLTNVMPQDTGYTFTTAGTWFGTRYRGVSKGHHGRYKRVKWIEFKTSGVTSGRTITPYVAMDGGTAVQVGQANSQSQNDGWQRITLPDNPELQPTGMEMQLQLAFATDSASASPVLTSTVRVGYEALTPEERWAQ